MTNTAFLRRLPPLTIPRDGEQVRSPRLPLVDPLQRARDRVADLQQELRQAISELEEEIARSHD